MKSLSVEVNGNSFAFRCDNNNAHTQSPRRMNALAVISMRFVSDAALNAKRGEFFFRKNRETCFTWFPQCISLFANKMEFIVYRLIPICSAIQSKQPKPPKRWNRKCKTRHFTVHFSSVGVCTALANTMFTCWLIAFSFSISTRFDLHDAITWQPVKAHFLVDWECCFRFDGVWLVVGCQIKANRWSHFRDAYCIRSLLIDLTRQSSRPKSACAARFRWTNNPFCEIAVSFRSQRSIDVCHTKPTISFSSHSTTPRLVCYHFAKQPT